MNSDEPTVTQLYSCLMNKIEENEDSEESGNQRLTPKIRDEISKDLARTRTSERI